MNVKHIYIAINCLYIFPSLNSNFEFNSNKFDLNQMLMTGVFSKSTKISKVFPLYKKDYNTNMPK